MDGSYAYRSQCLPTPTQTLLLRAALGSGRTAQDAWERWHERMGDVRSALSGKDRLWIKRLLPLLLFSVKRNRLAADRQLLTFLKLAYTAEVARDAVCRRTGNELLRRLGNETLMPVVIRGFALSETVYGEPALRHCHDIDLFLEHGEMSQARHVLSRLDFLPDGGMPGDRVRFVHTSGLQVVLHRHLFPAEIDRLLLAEALHRCESRLIAGAMSTVLGPADALLHACTHAWSTGGCRSPLWICDVWFLLAGLRDSDWALAGHIARRAHAEKPLSLTLHYLETELDASVPSSISFSEPTNRCPS
jgi:Uncharacterised nucleotidyltransferase